MQYTAADFRPYDDMGCVQTQTCLASHPVWPMGRGKRHLDPCFQGPRCYWRPAMYPTPGRENAAPPGISPVPPTPTHTPSSSMEYQAGLDRCITCRLPLGQHRHGHRATCLPLLVYNVDDPRASRRHAHHLSSSLADHHMGSGRKMQPAGSQAVLRNGTTSVGFSSLPTLTALRMHQSQKLIAICVGNPIEMPDAKGHHEAVSRSSRSCGALCCF